MGPVSTMVLFAMCSSYGPKAIREAAQWIGDVVFPKPNPNNDDKGKNE